MLNMCVVDESHPAVYCAQEREQPQPLQADLGELPAFTGSSHKQLVATHNGSTEPVNAHESGCLYVIACREIYVSARKLYDCFRVSAIKVVHDHQREATQNRQITADSRAAVRGTASGRGVGSFSPKPRGSSVSYSKGTPSLACWQSLQPGGGPRAPAFGSQLLHRQQQRGMSASDAVVGEHNAGYLM